MAAQRGKRSRPGLNRASRAASAPPSSPIFVRFCLDCGTWEESDDPLFLTAYVMCPRCELFAVEEDGLQ